MIGSISKLPPAKRAEILQMMVEDVPVRAIVRITGVFLPIEATGRALYASIR